MRAKFILISSFLLLCAAFVSANAQNYKFAFGAGKAEKSFTTVSEKDVYDANKTYGFEQGGNVFCADKNGKTAAGFCASDKPFYFSAKVAEGNYKITATFGSKNKATETTVKAELRRLMLENVETKKGEFVTKTFIVNIRNPNFPGGEVKLKDREKTMEWWAWDNKLTLEFNGKNPAIDSLTVEKIESIPTIFILGDSTVCDQPREPYASWGQMLTRFFQPTIAVANHAESGESLRSSLGAKRLDKVLSLMKPGDFLLIQYAHNDEKDKSEGAGAFTTFKASLEKFVEETRKKGGIPILITPMHRRTFDENGVITNSHGDYPEAVRQVAKEKNVALIDLTAMSKTFYETLGKEKSGAAFKEGDGTHHSDYGAYELAKIIADSMKEQKLSIAKFLVKDFKDFDPRNPDAPETFSLAPSPLMTDIKPLGN